MRIVSIIIGLVLSQVAVAVGDVVYLRSGRSYSGTVSRQGDRVIIDVGAETISVPASDVLHVTKSKRTDKPVSPAEPTQPGRVGVQGPNAVKDVVVLDDGGADLVGALTPDPIVLSLMGKLAGTPAGMESFRLRGQIKQWQIAAHEQRRHVDGKWVSIEHVARRREAYVTEADELEDLAKRIARLRVRSSVQRMQQRTLKKEHGTRLRALARSWPDAQFRPFLSGIAEYHAGKYPPAELFFRRCSEAWPHVAGYHQARAMALLKLKRGRDALESALNALRLRPSSQAALNLVKESMKQTRGMHTAEGVYREAAALVATYAKPTRHSSRRDTEWLMPGPRPWKDRHGSLPVPPCDRLRMRRGLAVPISDRALLIDEAVVKDAAEIVLIAHGKAYPAQRVEVSHPRRGAKAPPVAMLTVEALTFTPLKVPEPIIKSRWSSKRKVAQTQPSLLADGQGVDIATVAMFPAMGSLVRSLRGRLKSTGKDGAFKLEGARLSPGDSAAPVMTAGGVLAGFLSGRTDPSLDNGGPESFVGPDMIGPIVARARRGTRSLRGRYHFSRVERTVTPASVKGRSFIVYAIFAERLSPKTED